MVCKPKLQFAGKHSQLDGSLVWPKSIAQAISLEKFAVTDRSAKTAKLFHLELFATYGILYQLNSSTCY